MPAMQEAFADTTADHLTITQILYRYCRSMDRMDKPLGYSVFHADAVVDYGDIFRGTGHGFIDFVTEQHAAMVATTHQISNILIVIDGDRASAESYVTANLRMELDGQPHQSTAWGRYCDNLSRRDGIWAIDRRQYIHDLDEARPVTPTGLRTAGVRDPADISYSVFGALRQGQ